MVATSPLASLLGGGGDPPNRNLSPEKSLYVRDVLTGLVGKRLTDLKDPDLRGGLSYLRYALGDATAQKMITHAMAFNQRRDVIGLSPEKRIQTFYDMGSSDPETHALLSRLGNLDKGPVAGLNSSPDMMNRIVSKRDTTAGPGAGTANLQPLASKVASLR